MLGYLRRNVMVLTGVVMSFYLGIVGEWMHSLGILAVYLGLLACVYYDARRNAPPMSTRAAWAVHGLAVALILFAAVTWFSGDAYRALFWVALGGGVSWAANVANKVHRA